MRPALIVAALALALAPLASGQSYFLRSGMPDYDQRRDALPNDGNMYCVPTSFVNLFKYMAGAGLPTMGGNSGNGYNGVTDFIALMGIWCFTDPYNGTANSWEPMSEWVQGHRFGKILYQMGYGPGWSWGANTIKNMMNSGAVAQIAYGRYRLVSGGWERYSGHAVTMVGHDYTNVNDKKLIVADPAWDDGDLDQQGNFSFQEKRTDNMTFTTIAWGQVSHARYTLGTGNNNDRRYAVDSMHVVLPVFAGWPYSGANGTNFKTRFPWHFEDATVNVSQDHLSTTASPAMDWCYDLGDFAFYYTTETGGIYRVDILGQSEEFIGTVPGIKGLVVGGSSCDLFLLAGGAQRDRIVRIDRDTLTQISIDLPERAMGIDYDVKGGGPSCMGSTLSRLHTADEDLTRIKSQRVVRSLEGQPLAKMFFYVDHTTGDALLCQQGARSYERLVQLSPRLRVSRRISVDPEFGTIRSFCPTEHGMVLMRLGDSLQTFDQNGLFVQTQFTGQSVQAAIGPIKMPRSMFAARAEDYTIPGWTNELPNGDEP